MTPIQSEVFSFLHIPIQEEGRIKPLDSFARNQLLKIYGKNKLTIVQCLQGESDPADIACR